MPHSPGERPIELMTPAMLADPYPFYDRLRSECPVYHHPRWNNWFLTRYSDVAAGLRNPRLSSARSALAAQRAGGNLPEAKEFYEGYGLSMIANDPPTHTRLRGLVSQAFTPRAVEAMTSRIQRIVDGLLDAVASRGRMDLIRELACPLPVIVIAEMLGIPPTDLERFKHWSDTLSVVAGGRLFGEDFVRISSARRELVAYFAEVVAQRRKVPRDDLLTALAQAEEAGDRLTEAELYNNASLLLVTGNETTTNLIGNGMLALLRNPDQLRKLLEAPDLIETAVEEFLRYDAPVQWATRIPLDDTKFGDVIIPQGSVITLLLGAANRDPVRFPAPGRLEITRPDNQHLAFGAGPHFCLGAPLARLQAKIAFTTLLRRFPKLRLDGPVEHRPNFNLRGLKALSLAF